MESETDKFKESFKYYKAKQPPPDLSKAIDFNKFVNIDLKNKALDDGEIAEYQLKKITTPLLLGIKPVSEWRAFQLCKHPGFVLILNPFENGYQKYWIKRCMEDYHLPPNVTNLDPHMDRSQISMLYENFVKKNREELHKDDLLVKLRWVTLGYHYDWTAKKYYADKFTEFPHDLSTLSRCIAEATGHEHFSAEAGIVNYYHMDSTLAGHTDHSEFDQQAPLLSISFGQDAVFLLGGVTRASQPTAMVLHSGDICVMGGQSRLAYHAVPRVISSSTLSYTQEIGNFSVGTALSICSCSTPCSHTLNNRILRDLKSINWKPMCVFLKTSRINLNIRQVLKIGQDFPKEVDYVPASKKLKVDPT